MSKKDVEEQFLKKSQAVKNKLSAISKLPEKQALASHAAVFAGFSLRFNLLNSLIKSLISKGIKPIKAIRASKTFQKDICDKLYDKEDLYLLRLKEIMLEKSIQRRKIWNIKLPKTDFESLYKPQSYDTPISHYSIAAFPLDKEKELTWVETKIPEPERQYVLTRITDFNKTSG